MLRELKPETEYKVTLVPVYPDVEGKHVSENGKTSECGLLQVVGPVQARDSRNNEMVPVLLVTSRGSRGFNLLGASV